jgi:predicted DNA-binding transcriptional regulator AlpA
VSHSAEITKAPPRKAQVPFAKKAAKLKAAGEAKRPQPAWLRMARQIPAKPEVEAPLTPERERAADRSQGPPRLMPKAEVCALVGATYPTVWGWMRAGTFPRSRIVGGKSMWLSTEIDAWMANLPVRRLKGDPPPSSEVA